VASPVHSARTGSTANPGRLSPDLINPTTVVRPESSKALIPSLLRRVFG
jgi:hypothetical protein